MFIHWDYIISHLLIGMSFILGFVFLLTKAPIFRNIMLKSNLSWGEKLFYTVFFGVIGILGTYTGFATTDGIANTRAVGIIVGGLVGGPFVGIGAGLIAGVHRFFVGGLTAYSSCLAAIIEGLIAGFCYYRFRQLSIRWPYALMLGCLLEALHMGILLLISRPFDRVLTLVETISPSMLVIDPLGIAMFIAILDGVYAEQEQVGGKAAKMALQIAGRTLDYLRSGLDETSAYKTAQTILESANNLDGVAVVSPQQVLAFIGAGADHHIDFITAATRRVLDTGEPYLAQSRQDIGCVHAGCPIKAAVAAPLKDRDNVIGAIAFFKTTPNSINPFEIELIGGLAQLISTQIEASKAEKQSTLRAVAEIRALQAQINPHFLFNAINTIVYYVRKKPEAARNLLLNLGDFYRNNLSGVQDWVDIHTELNHVDAYVQIESARFQGKLKVTYRVPAECHIKVPPLILQPIVENAVKHGLYPRKEGGSIDIEGRMEQDSFWVTIADNGVGIPPDVLQTLLTEDTERKSIGLSNVHRRLQAIYGQKYGLVIESQVGEGTTVTIPFPLRKEPVIES